jgi:hypothetical protein
MSGPPVRSRRSPAADPRRRTGTDWYAELDRLDALRGRAYATRDTELLRRVYVAGTLLRVDAGQLIRLVPAGCGLAGVRSHYARLELRAARTRGVLTVRATLAPSRLSCGGRPRGTAAGAGPTTLRVVLVRTPAGVRIADEQRA